MAFKNFYKHWVSTLTRFRDDGQTCVWSLGVIFRSAQDEVTSLVNCSDNFSTKVLFISKRLYTSMNACLLLDTTLTISLVRYCVYLNITVNTSVKFLSELL